MFKKIILASAIFAASSLAFAATGPYVGASAGVNIGKFTKYHESSSRSPIANLFAGYGALINPSFYLGGEIFANLTNLEAHYYYGLSDGYHRLKNKYSAGISVIPGVMLTDQIMAYARLGLVGGVFENENFKRTLAGGQAGIGVQTSLTQHLDVRGEYDFTQYQSKKIGSVDMRPRSNTLTVGLAYKFD